MGGWWAFHTKLKAHPPSNFLGRQSPAALRRHVRALLFAQQQQDVPGLEGLDGSASFGAVASSSRPRCRPVSDGGGGDAGGGGLPAVDAGLAKHVAVLRLIEDKVAAYQGGPPATATATATATAPRATSSSRTARHAVVPSGVRLDAALHDPLGLAAGPAPPAPDAAARLRALQGLSTGPAVPPAGAPGYAQRGGGGQRQGGGGGGTRRRVCGPGQAAGGACRRTRSARRSSWWRCCWAA